MYVIVDEDGYFLRDLKICQTGFNRYWLKDLDKAFKFSTQYGAMAAASVLEHLGEECKVEPVVE